MATLEFVSDRDNPQIHSAGEFAPHADQKKYRSIWGLVDGEGTGFRTAHELQQGIFSADGKLRLRLDEFKDASGKPHEIKHRKATLREFIVPIEVNNQWNAYERAQGEKKEADFKANHEAKMRGFGLKPETEDVKDEFIQVGEPGTAEVPVGPNAKVTVAVPSNAPKRGRGWPKGKSRGPRATATQEAASPSQ